MAVAPLIAVVALNAPGRDGATAVFDYRVPPALHGTLNVGHLVWVPLRQKRVQGVVLSLSYTTDRDSAGLRDLIDLADQAAQIPPAGLQLAAWIAETYRAPLYEALTLVLPPGVGQQAITTWQATPQGAAIDLGSLPERERAVLYYLRINGEQGEDALRSVLRGSDADLRAIYSALAERGLIRAGATVSARRSRPRIITVAQLSLAPDQIPIALTELARAPRQQAVLRWMQEQGNGAAQSGEADTTTAANPLLPTHAITAATGVPVSVLRDLARRGWVVLSQVEVRRDPLAATILPPDLPPPLTSAQRNAYEQIVVALEAATAFAHAPTTPPPTFLLHGITGSGKTEVYLRSIGRALRLGRQALVLVPEIALTVQLVRRFAARFPGQVAVLHSGLALGERYDEWRRLQRGEARVVVGSRSAVLRRCPILA